MIQSGGFFGEVGIMFDMKRTASIRARTRCILSKITKFSLDQVCSKYPEFKASISKEAADRQKLFLERLNSVNADGDAIKVELFDVEVSMSNLRQVYSFHVDFLV